jgi:holliday junction DNA helicase RuvA
MYEYLCGKLQEITTSYAIIDINGIGYKITIPIHLFGKLSLNTTILFFTYLVIKEDSHILYGFEDKNERNFFEKLIHISGIGPKTALSLIGHLPLPLFSEAIEGHQVATLTKVPGIGKKTAERLLLELKGKIPSFCEKTQKQNLNHQKLSDALAALINLGYSQTLARKAIDKALLELPQECDLPSIISFALKIKL